MGVRHAKDPRSKVVRACVTAKDLARIEAAAEVAGMTTSTWLLAVARAALIRQEETRALIARLDERVQDLIDGASALQVDLDALVEEQLGIMPTAPAQEKPCQTTP